MTSIVAISNLALSNIGKQNISDPAEPTSEARACNQFFAHVRDTLLQAYPWRFAGKTQSLAAVTNDRVNRWQYAYSRPNDCLKIRLVRPDYADTVLAGEDDERLGVPYDWDGQTIYCHVSPAILRYTARLSDPTKFPPLFVEAFAWHLAVRLAMPLTRDPKVRQSCFEAAQQMQATAATADANEVRETSDHTTEFVTERDDG